jgi:hypothetical protein
VPRLPAGHLHAAGVDGQLPSLHVGVVTTDLGTRSRLDPQPGPPIGHCAGDGDAGKLATFNAGLSFGNFLEDLRGPGGTRIRNFDSGLVPELARLTDPAPGTANTGCEFPQPLEAMRRALDPATNPDFIRPGAVLAIVFLTSQDDCSLARGAMLDPFDTSLGPSLAFRCTEQGVICDPDDPRKPGTHTGCRPRERSAFLVDVSEYQTFLAHYKPDPRDVVVSAVAGPRSPFEVRNDGAPALAPSCQGAGGSARPAVRIGALVDRFGGALIDGCTQDAAYQQITAPIAGRHARQIVDNAARVVALELLCGCRALEFRRPLMAGEGCEMLYGAIRRVSPAPDGDRPLSGPCEDVSRWVLSGAPVTLADEVLSA